MGEGWGRCGLTVVLCGLVELGNEVFAGHAEWLLGSQMRVRAREVDQR